MPTRACWLCLLSCMLQPEESSASEGEEQGSDFEQEVVGAKKQRGAPGGGRQRKAAVMVSERVRWEAHGGGMGIMHGDMIMPECTRIRNMAAPPPRIRAV